jgi:hypothetical protein
MDELRAHADGGGAPVDIDVDRLLDAFVGSAAGRPVHAVRHPLGFVCLPLWRLTGLGLCIHVWTRKVEPAGLTTSTVHCHSWDLASLVLYGAVCNEEIHVFDAAEPTHRVFDIEQDGDVDEIRATARKVRYRVRASSLSTPGQVYRLSAGVFHNTVVPTREAATLVVAWNRSGGADRSVGPLDVGTHRLQRRRCDAEEGAQAVRAVAERLAQAGAARRPPGGREELRVPPLE